MQYREFRFPSDYACVLALASRPGAHTGNEATARAVVQNINSRGARIRTDSPLAEGDDVLLSLPGGPRRARVRWVRDGQAGLRFDTVLTAQTISAVRGSTGSRLARTGWNLHLREFG